MPKATDKEFSDAFRTALIDFLERKGIKKSQMAKDIGISKSRLNTYCRATEPACPDAEVLYSLCAMKGFEFKYRGYIISAATLAGVAVSAPKDVAQQISFDFERQFKLTNEAGELSVTVKRPGRIELSVSLAAVAS